MNLKAHTRKASDDAVDLNNMQLTWLTRNEIVKLEC